MGVWVWGGGLMVCAEERNKCGLQWPLFRIVLSEREMKDSERNVCV